MKRILITGGAGFIGSHLTEALRLQNKQIQVIDNFATGKHANLKQAKVFVWHGGVAEGELMSEVFESFKPDTVIHCAASYADPGAWFTDVGTNILGTINVVRACDVFNVEKLVYFQTSLCYGLQPQSPIQPDHPIAPSGSYAISKVAGERYIMEGNVPWVSLRLANIYGPRNLSGPVPTFYKRLKDGKECFVVDSKRDFVYISDLVRVVMKVLESDTTGVYHVASGQDYPILDVFNAVASAMEIDVDTPEIRERGTDDAATILLDATKTMDEFDWKPRVSLEDGITKAVRWYKKNDVGETYTHLKINDNGKENTQ